MIDEQTIEDLMNEEDDIIVRDSEEEADLTPIIQLDIEDVNTKASQQAQLITERLSNYYFDEKYIKEHPYIPVKIMTEMENIRRLLKMLLVNESAQDALIKAICLCPSKGTLYLSLTSLQKSILLIQKQLNDLTASIENIFQKMQDETERAWVEKDKEEGDDGTITVRGSKEFILMLQKKHAELMNRNQDDSNMNKDLENKEVVNEDGTPEGATKLEDIIG